MAKKTCYFCNKEMGLLEFGFNLHGKNQSITCCKECGNKIQDEINQVASLRTMNERLGALNQFRSDGAYSEEVIECIGFMADEIVKKNEAVVTLSITSGNKDIGLGLFSSTTKMYQKAEGFIYFEGNPDKLYRPEGYSWDGPQYNTVTTSTENSKTKNKGKEKRKGGIGGAVVGTMLMPGIGTAIGYAATSKKVSKGDSETNTKATINENQVEVDSPAFIQLRDENNQLISIGFNCNSKLHAQLMGFEWNIDEKSTPEVDATIKAANASAELDRVKLLKEYKELLDSGVISQEEFDAKKKEVLG